MAEEEQADVRIDNEEKFERFVGSLEEFVDEIKDFRKDLKLNTAAVRENTKRLGEVIEKLDSDDGLLNLMDDLGDVLGNEIMEAAADIAKKMEMLRQAIKSYDVPAVSAPLKVIDGLKHLRARREEDDE